jgi:hypothetical protein
MAVEGVFGDFDNFVVAKNKNQTRVAEKINSETNVWKSILAMLEIGDFATIILTTSEMNVSRL